jgi:hypothetical protein
MPVHDIVILSLIVGVFAAFGVVLASLTWYCGAGFERARRRAERERGNYPSHAGFMTDD